MSEQRMAIEDAADFGKVAVSERVLIKADRLYPEALERIEGRFKYIRASYTQTLLARALAGGADAPSGPEALRRIEVEDFLPGGEAARAKNPDAAASIGVVFAHPFDLCPAHEAPEGSVVGVHSPHLGGRGGDFPGHFDLDHCAILSPRVVAGHASPGSG